MISAQEWECLMCCFFFFNSVGRFDQSAKCSGMGRFGMWEASHIVQSALCMLFIVSNVLLRC